MTQYRVLQGIDYPPNKRAEAGDVVNDLPASSVKWLLEVGAIEDASKPKSEPKVEIVEEVKPIKEKKEKELPRRYGKANIVKDIASQGGKPTNAQLTALAINDLKNIYNKKF